MLRGSPMRSFRFHGFVLIGVLATLLILALSAQLIMSFASEESRRERETELLLIGLAYVNAIAAYHQASPGNIKQYPTSVSDLLEDRRFIVTKRYLRQAYPDPITRSNDWVFIRNSEGALLGLHSKSLSPPIRSAAFQFDRLILKSVTRYADWHFVFEPAPEVSVASI